MFSIYFLPPFSFISFSLCEYESKSSFVNNFFPSSKAKEFNKSFKVYKIESTGTITKNHSFIVKKFGKPKYFLKLPGEQKPLKEKKATDFYNLNEIVKTPKIISIGKDYTLTAFEHNLNEPNFIEHISNLANFHYKLMNTDHEKIKNDKKFHTMPRENLFNFIKSKGNLLEKIISPKKFYSLLSKFPNSEELGINPILIHGDPHKQNLLIKNNESFFLDLEHTRYSSPTTDLARLAYNYSPSQLENILAIYSNSFDKQKYKLSKKDFITGTISDILLDGASSVITCKVKNIKPELTKNWINKFKNYFEYLSNLA